ncbi:MAG: cell division protein SepF [Frankiales bacterium]|nr:cell division protein SepF [Frankiales bacterium]
MPGLGRKVGLYLGLVEDDEDGRGHYGSAYEDDDYDDEPETAPVRQWAPGARSAAPSRDVHGSVALDTAPPQHASLRAAPPAPERPYADAYRITTLHPRTYNEARTIGEHFRAGTPVIMNLTEMDDVDAKRLVDFAAGLIFGLHGSIERVTNKVFLLSPEHVEVTAEDKQLIAEGGFFNQS